MRGKIIGPFGGQSKGMPAEAGEFWKFECLDADSPDEIVKAIHEDIYYGADVIKLATEAHNAGRALAVHGYGGPAADAVIRGGADSVEHGFALTDEQLRLMKEKGTFLVGTDFPTEHLAG